MNFGQTGGLFILTGILNWTAWNVPAAPARQTSDRPLNTRTYQLFSMPIEVTGLPRDGEFVPVSCRIDFSRVLKDLKAPGVVDERALRLYRITSLKRREEVPFQFSAAEQPRAKVRHLLPGTSSSVSYVAEYAAGEIPEGIGVGGELTWIVRKPKNGAASFLLEFGVPRMGKQVQVPYPPQNLRGFDDVGRASEARWFPNLQLHPQWPMDGVVHFQEERELLTSYHLGPWLNALTNSTLQFRRPFFYPVNGPGGVSFTEFGKPHDPTGSHAHHYSLWVAHNNVSEHDFWSEKAGVIAHEQLELMEDGPVFCRLIQRSRWLDKGEELLKERRSVTFYPPQDNFRILDIQLELTPAGAKEVVFGKTSFGFLAARVAQSMTVFDGGGEIRTAAGKLNEQGAHLTHAAWLDQSGPVSQIQWGGIAILDHPENVNFPTGWHCRNDGWAGAAFNMEGPYTLEPGKVLRLRYRIVLHRHDAIKGEVAKRFEEWSARARVRTGIPRQIN